MHNLELRLPTWNGMVRVFLTLALQLTRRFWGTRHSTFQKFVSFAAKLALARELRCSTMDGIRKPLNLVNPKDCTRTHKFQMLMGCGERDGEGSVQLSSCML